MDNRSNGEKLKELYTKALSTSLLLNLTEEEARSMITLSRPETPKSWEKESKL